MVEYVRNTPPHSGLNSFQFTPDFLKRPFKSNGEGDIQDLNLESGDVSLFTCDIRKEIITRIRRYDVCVGCSPWFLPSDIRRELERKTWFSIVTNDDTSIIKPDQTDNAASSAESIGKEAIQEIRFETPRYRRNFPHGLAGQIGKDALVRQRDLESAYGLEFVRSIANSNRYARLHCKFLVFLTIKNGRFIAEETMLGSFNLNNNPTYSFELMIGISRKPILERLLQVWYQILMCALYQRDKSLVDAHWFDREAEAAEEATLDQYFVDMLHDERWW